MPMAIPGMSEQLGFRLAFAGLFLLLFVVVASYRRTAQAGREFDYSKEGNPLYTAGGLVFSGLGLLAASWFLVAGAVLAVVLAWLRLPREEADLEARFGQECRDYVSGTGRFLPRWKR